MDKYEYKLRAEEIKKLISQKKYVEAAKVADSIDWSRVKSVAMLCTVSDVYKINRNFQEAKALLLMANERHPSGRMILYSLCDLAIRMGEVVDAIAYYREFESIAPNDSGKYVLQYKLYEAQDVSLEERIAVLEELKKRDYREKWAYELAYLYHRVGLATKCVEECDDLILWFGDGKYVMKAMELKTLHQPLSPMQQQKFDVYMMKKQGLNVPESMLEPLPAFAGGQTGELAPEAPQDMDIQVKTMDVGKYNTINLQKELAESMKELLPPGQAAPEPVSLQNYREQMYQEPENTYGTMDTADIVSEEYGNQQSGMNRSDYAYVQEVPDAGYAAASQYAAEPQYAAKHQYTAEPRYAAEPQYTETPRYTPEPQSVSGQPSGYDVRRAPGEDMYNRYLSQEYDGQISLAVPDAPQVEKQITGQMNIEDIMREWEKMKRDNEEKRRQELKQRVLEQTGSLFRDFDETSRAGMLERLQKEERIPVERRQRPSESVVSAQTKIWAAGEVENALKTAASAPAGTVSLAGHGLAGSQSVPVVPQPVSASEGKAVPEGMSELSFTPAAEASRVQPVPVPPVASVPAQSAAEVPVQPAASVPTQPAESVSVQSAAEAPVQPAATVSARPTGEALAQPVASVPAQPVVSAPVRPVASVPVQPVASVPVQPAVSAPVQPAPAAPAQETPVQEPYEYQNTAAPLEEDPADYREYEQSAEAAPAADTGKAIPFRKKEDVSDGQQEEDEETGRPAEQIRNMSADEKRLFASFVPTKGAMKRLTCALDRLSLAAYTGNLILTGDPGADTMELAKNIIRDMKAKDRNFSGKLAKITGDSLNGTKKDPAELVEKLSGGALLIDGAGDISPDSMAGLLKALNQDRWGILVILIDTKRCIRRLTEENPDMEAYFNARFDIEALDNSTLVAYGCQYARNQEYAIDELGRLALHTRIEDMQTSDHIVTVNDVRDIVDEAIDRANRKTPRHFMQVLLAKRYDDDDMIILHEGDFI